MIMFASNDDFGPDTDNSLITNPPPHSVYGL